MKKLNRKGMALPIVIMVLLVVTIVGFTILAVALGEARQVAYQDKHMQAYYLAKSGADVVSNFILEHPKPTDINPLVNAGKSDANSEMSNGTFEVEVKTVGSINQLVVESKGTVHDVDATLKLYIRKLDLNAMLDKAIYSNRALDIKNMIVTEGDIQSGEDIKYTPPGSHNEFLETAYPYSPRTMELDWGPATSGLTQLASLPADRIINGSCILPETVDLGIGDNLTFKTNNTDMVVVANNLSIKDSIIIQGTGTVFLYVENNMTVQTNGDINTAPANQFFVFLKDGSSLNIQAGKILNGYIIGPQATVYVQSDQTQVNGAIYADVVLKNTNNGPNGSVKYIPLTDQIGEDGYVYEYRVVGWE